MTELCGGSVEYTLISIHIPRGGDDAVSLEIRFDAL